MLWILSLRCALLPISCWKPTATASTRWCCTSASWRYAPSSVGSMPCLPSCSPTGTPAEPGNPTAPAAPPPRPRSRCRPRRPPVHRSPRRARSRQPPGTTGHQLHTARIPHTRRPTHHRRRPRRDRRHHRRTRTPPPRQHDPTRRPANRPPPHTRTAPAPAPERHSASERWVLRTAVQRGAVTRFGQGRPVARSSRLASVISAIAASASCVRNA